jgi:hypothetical protein
MADAHKVLPVAEQWGGGARAAGDAGVWALGPLHRDGCAVALPLPMPLRGTGRI